MCLKAAGAAPASNAGMRSLLLLNDPPYGTERSYNALRLALSLAKTASEESPPPVRVFLMGDAAACGKAGQKVPAGYYNVADMLSMLARRGVPIAVCGSCLDARGIGDAELVAGAHRGSMAELTEWYGWAERVTVF